MKEATLQENTRVAMQLGDEDTRKARKAAEAEKVKIVGTLQKWVAP